MVIQDREDVCFYAIGKLYGGLTIVFHIPDIGRVHVTRAQIWKRSYVKIIDCQIYFSEYQVQLRVFGCVQTGANTVTIYINYYKESCSMRKNASVPDVDTARRTATRC